MPTIQDILNVYGGTVAEAEARLASFYQVQDAAARAQAEAEAQINAALMARAAVGSDPNYGSSWNHQTQSFDDPNATALVEALTPAFYVEPVYTPPPVVTTPPVVTPPPVTTTPTTTTTPPPLVPGLDYNAEVQRLKSNWSAITGQPANMSDEAVYNFIRNNPYTYNIDFLNVLDEFNASQLKQEALNKVGVEAAYDPHYDLDRDGAITTTDANLLGSGEQLLSNQEVVWQSQIDEAVQKALQNGFTTQEIQTIAEELKIAPNRVTNAFTRLVGSQSDADIITGVTALATTGGITYENIVKYADENKLPYATVANALKSTFTNTTQDQIIDSMVYEKDRQQFSALAKPSLDKDGKPVLDAKGNPVTTVNLGDAIAESIKQGIAPENLAKFYGKTDAEFKDLVNTNLSNIASTLRSAGIDAQQGLTDLLGVDKSATQNALRDFDVTTKLQALQKDKLTYSEILGVAKENNIPIADFVNKYLGGDNKEALINALTAETQFTPQEQALREAFRGMETAPTMQQVLDYQRDAKLSDAEMERIFGDLTKVSANDLDKTKTSLRLEELKSDGTLTLNEILGVVQDKNISVNDFVNLYLGGDDKQKTEVISSLNKELEFSPQERAWREAYSNIDEPINIKQASDFQTANKLSDADMQRIFNIPAESLDNYRVSTALQGYSGEDNQLSYAELTQFAKDNNMDLSKVVDYIGTEETRPEILKNLQDYVKDEEFKSSLSDVKLTDYKGAQYSANQLLNLANQVKQNFDLENSSGGVYKTSGQSVGFDYNEAKKLFPEGKDPTVFDQVALDIARGLLKSGVTDISDLSKYKPTEVTEYDYNVEAGPPVEYKVTKLINPETGEEAPSLGATYTGQGGTVYGFTVDESGKPVFNTTFTDTSDKKAVTQLVSIGAAFLAPQILPQLIGAAPAAVAGVEGAVAQAALGGTGLTGSLMAAGIPASVAGYAATAIVNGVYNGIVAEATGGDFEKAFINGGVAPVLGQLATNAVNSMVTGLPSGVASAVGNAVTQLITTGEIDPGQLAIAGIKPTAVQTIIDASGGALNAATARLVFDTVASGGKNITSLADNPAGVVNFVIKNQDVFNNIATAAATGTDQKPAAADISSLDTVQQEVLTSQPRTETIQGEALFQDINQTELGRETAEIGIVKPPGEVITTDTSGTSTGPDPYAGYDNAVKFAEALASGATEFDGVEAATKLRQALSSGALDFYNYDLAKLEAQLVGNQPTLEKARQAAETLYGEGAAYRYDGKLYEGNKPSEAIQIKDSKGNVFDVPSSATLNKNATGAIVGYTHNGTTYEYQNGKMVPLASEPVADKYTLDAVKKLSLDQLTSLYRSVDPNADKKITIPGTGQVTTPYQQWLMRYAANPAMAVDELNVNKEASNQNNASFLQTVAKNIGNVVTELRSSDNKYVRSVGDKLATNATLLGEVAKGITTTLSSPAELFTAIAFGDPNNQISKWASGVRTDITAAQAAVDPEWQKTKAFMNEQLTKVGAEQGQVDQFLAAADAYANNPRAIADMIASTIPSVLPGVGAYTALTKLGATGTAAYLGGAFAAATGSQTDLVEMADKTYENILKQVKTDNPDLTEQQAQEKAAAGTALSMRAAGLISLAGSAAIQLLPGAQFNNVLGRVVAREIGQEIGDETWVKATSNAWQGKDLQDDLGRTVLESILASGPISAATQSLSESIGRPYDQSQVIKNVTWELVDGGPSFNQGVALLTGPNNQLLLNSANQPILLTYDQSSGLSTATDVTASGVKPMEANQSTATESIFDIVFDNEANGGYTVNAVSLDGNTYTVTDSTGKTQVIDTNGLLNNALNIVTQANPTATQELMTSNPLEGFLTQQVAKMVDINAVSGSLQVGNIVSANQKGAFAITDTGGIVFLPNTQTSGSQGVSMADLQNGDSVVFGNGYVAPAKQEVDASGGVQVKVDELKINPLSGFGRVIGLDESQALVVLPNQELLTINRSSLTPTQNQGLTQGSLVPYNESTVTQRGVTADTAMSTFGLTQEQLLQGMTTPSTADRLPVLVKINTPNGASVINTALPDVSVGKVVSIDPAAQTALVASAIGNPQVINLQGMSPEVGSDLFFNPATSMALGTPITTAPVTQTQPSGLGSLIPTTYTPIGTTPPAMLTPDVPPVVTQPPIVPVGVDTISSGGGEDTLPGIGIDTVEGGVTPTIPPPVIDVPAIPPPVIDVPSVVTPPVVTPPVVTPPVVTPPVVTPPVVTPPVVTPPVVTPPSFPPFFFMPGERETRQLEFGYPVVPAPELYGTYEMPYPNYLRPLDPYLGYGIGALMGDLYDEKQGYGGYQPFQNAQGQIKIPT